LSLFGIHLSRCQTAIASHILVAIAATLMSSHATALEVKGDELRGKELYEQRCGGCHSIDTNRIGPNHAGLFGRRVGSVHDFDYSKVLKKSKLAWNEKLMDAWLTDPEKTFPGQKMNYQVPDAQARADIIEFLKKQQKK
jgi:cytochrome c